MMKVHFYQDLQMGIARQLMANPEYPYSWSSRPVFEVRDMDGEWLAADTMSPTTTLQE